MHTQPQGYRSIIVHVHGAPDVGMLTCKATGSDPGGLCREGCVCVCVCVYVCICMCVICRVCLGHGRSSPLREQAGWETREQGEVLECSAKALRL